MDSIRLLVTGSEGQLGRCLRERLGRESGIEATYTDVGDLDITNPAEVEDFVAAGGFTHIVNCAAYTAVDKAEEQSVLAASINTDGVGNIGRAARHNHVKVLHISTDYVFPGDSCRPYNEHDRPDPKSIYGRTKLEGECLLTSLCPDSVVIRTAWLYSEHGNNFVKTIVRKLREGAPLRVVADQIGTPTYAADLADAICHILTREEWHPGIYHYTDEGVASWYDFAKAIACLGGYEDAEISAVATADYPTAARRPLYSVLDKTKIKSVYGLEIPYWVDSLRKCIDRLA